MNVLKTAKDNYGIVASFCTILMMMFFLFATKWDLEAVAQTVDIIRCKQAMSKLNDYEAAILMSGREPTELMKDAMIDLQVIIDQTCPKKQ